MDLFNKAAQFLAQPPATHGYSVAELTEMSIWQRIRVQLWTLELVTLGFTVGFLLLFKAGDWYNTNKVNLFLDGLTGILAQNFAQVGVSSEASGPRIEKDTPENFAGYATGRENIELVKFDFKLQPRHNILIWIFEWLLSFFTTTVRTPSDRAEIVITPSQGYDNFIAAIVNKMGMNDARSDNYFLSLTKTTDSDALPVQFVYMTEVSELQEVVFAPEVVELLYPGLHYVAFTDMPTLKPEGIRDLIPQRRIVLNVDISTNSGDLAKLSQLLEGLFTTIDAMVAGEIKIKGETLKKVVKTRDNEVQKIQKLLDLEKEDLKREELAKKEREERERRRKLSREEQLRLEKKEMDKKQKKMMKKQRVRM